jgi:hypothetical protein
MTVDGRTSGVAGAGIRSRRGPRKLRRGRVDLTRRCITLCIGRNELESIVIGKAGDVLTEPIVITVCPRPPKFRHRTRVGITAQKDVAIVRTELLEHRDQSDAAERKRAVRNGKDND